MTGILCHCEKTTPRVKYSLKLLLGHFLGLEVHLTPYKEEFDAFTGPKFTYGHKAIGDHLHFSSANILFEKGVKDQTISVFSYSGVPALFKVNDTASALPFDPFSAAFFLVSRYEECLPHLRDHYDRFEAEQSFAFQHGFLHQPVVDHWVIHISNVLKKRWPELKFKQREYRYISTIDIDNAYAYKNKGLLRTVGALAKAGLDRNFKEIRNRLKVIAGSGHDPYDTYDYQLTIQRKYDLEVIYFFLLADYGLNDKNVPHYSSEFRSLIKHLADYGKIGIHPGFGSNKKPSKLKIEKERLEEIMHRKVVRSRQHFLILHLPQTYRRLIDLDITEDHTMGYAQCTGFRAGTCTPYPFYDLDLEVETPLMVYPFAVMDATLKYYMKLKPEESLQHVEDLVRQVREVNGTFISLWHNETLSDEGLWEGWRKVYEHLVKVAHNPIAAATPQQ